MAAGTGRLRKMNIKGLMCLLIAALLMAGTTLPCMLKFSMEKVYYKYLWN